MSDKLIASLSKKSDSELCTLRHNTQTILDEPSETARHQRAELLLDAIDKELEQRHLPGMIATFHEEYPDGFYGQAYLDIERNYKVEASELCKELLAQLHIPAQSEHRF